MGYRMAELQLSVERNRGEGGPIPVAIGWWILGEGEPYFVTASAGMAWPAGK